MEVNEGITIIDFDPTGMNTQSLSLNTLNTEMSNVRDDILECLHYKP